MAPSDENIKASKVRFPVTPAAWSIFHSTLLSEIQQCKKQNIVFEFELTKGSVRRNF